ncbi:MAG: phosphate/phosphite/phosphonate ABC transporter substrate-binding protein [Magnetococcus sp. DMHC-8]
MTQLVARAMVLGWLLIGGVLMVGTARAAGLPLTIGSISNDPAKEIRRFLPVAHHLAAQLASHGIGRGQVVIAANMPEMVNLIKNGQVDLYLDSPLPSVLVNHLAGSTMALRRWKKGTVEYSAVVFVKKESPIRELAQLVGKRVAFKDLHSSSSYLLPRIAMEQAGLQMVELADGREDMPAGKTGYLFTNDRETSLFWVAMGKVDAGAMSREELAKQARGEMDQLRVIHETVAIPRHVVNLRGDLPAPLARDLVQALLGMEQDATGKRLLGDFEHTTRFDPVPPQTLARLREMTPAILAILGESP